MKIKILGCDIASDEGEPINAKVGQIVDTVPCPEEYKDRFKDEIWVMGKTEPVRLLRGEYIFII